MTVTHQVTIPVTHHLNCSPESARRPLPQRLDRRRPRCFIPRTITSGEDTLGKVKALLQLRNLRLQVIAKIVDRFTKDLQLFLYLRHVMTLMPKSKPVPKNTSTGHDEDSVDHRNHDR